MYIYLSKVKYHNCDLLSFYKTGKAFNTIKTEKDRKRQKKMGKDKEK